MSCNGCGKPMKFIRTPAGRAMPVDPDPVQRLAEAIDRLGGDEHNLLALLDMLQNESLDLQAQLRDAQEAWIFDLDDHCYRVLRGASLLVMPEIWMSPEQATRAVEHVTSQGLACRICGPSEGPHGVEIARWPWVFELMDAAEGLRLRTVDGASAADALIGVLLGYSGEAIDAFIRKEGSE